MADESLRLCVLKISLENTDPLIWRRVVVPADCALDLLHFVIQIAMGWECSHLYQFEINGEQYADLELMEGDSGRCGDASEAMLDKLGLSPGDKFGYVYDFGDDWSHCIEIEEIRDAKPFEPEFGCRAGAGNSPPEDCGGILGFEDIIRAKNDAKHPRWKELSEWMDLEGYDPDWFDPDEVNQHLQLELLLDDETVSELLEGDKKKTNGRKQDMERMFQTFTLFTMNQMMRDEPKETRATVERLVNSGLDEDHALAMVVSAVGTEMFECASENRPFDLASLLRKFEELPLED